MRAKKLGAFAATSLAVRSSREGPAGDGWRDISGGEERCWMRHLSFTPGAAEQRKPWKGCQCEVLCTAWLGIATREGFRPSVDRLGRVQPNATIDFTLGGGGRESTLAWDAAVAEMRCGDRVEVFAMPDFAFGEKAMEPYVPAQATVFFELTLAHFSDWAEGQDVIYGLDKAYDPDFPDPDFSHALEDTGEYGPRTLLDDVMLPENDLAAQDDDDQVVDATLNDDDVVVRATNDDVAASQATKTPPPPPPPPPQPGQDDEAGRRRPNRNPNKPKFGKLSEAPAIPVDGEGQGYSWSENADELELRVKAPTAVTRHDVKVDLRPMHLVVSVHDKPILGGRLAGEVAPDDSTWAVSEDGLTVDLVLAKQKRRRPSPDRPPTMEDIWATVFMYPLPPKDFEHHPKNQQK